MKIDYVFGCFIGKFRFKQLEVMLKGPRAPLLNHIYFCY